jgi:peptidoglycan/LPS O-acetylase OafA/YrhL
MERMPGLDGLRGLAILGILAFHERAVLATSGVEGAVRRVFDYGWLAVDLFFVLSGFLITGILLDSLKRIPAGGISGYFKTFYIRRSLRIFPIYYVYLAVAAMEWKAYQRVGSVGIWWYVLYIDNWKPGHGSLDWEFAHLWSLAVEEQFYLAWPLVVLLSSRKHLVKVCLGTIACVACIRLVLHFGLHVSDEGIYRTTICRMDSFAIGALAMHMTRSYRELLVRHGLKIYAAAAIFCLSGMAVLDSPMGNTIGWCAISMGFGLLVAIIALSPARVVQWAPLRRIGLVSYSMYLFHQVAYTNIWGAIARPLNLKAGLLNPVGHGIYLIAGTGAIYALAEFTFRFIEAPFQEMRKRFDDIPRDSLTTSRLPQESARQSF